MEDVMKGYKVPAFGNWNFCNEKPIAQHVQSLKEADHFIAAHFFVENGEDDLFKVIAPQRKGKKRGAEMEGNKLCYERKMRKPRAVDEDLYNIPPDHLLCQIPNKKKKLLWNFWAGCLCLNCIA